METRINSRGNKEVKIQPDGLPAIWVEKKAEILNIDPFAKEFSKAKSLKDYRTTIFQKKLVVPNLADKVFNLKTIDNFGLCLIYPIIEGYIKFLSEKGIYKKEIIYISNVLKGASNKELIDITQHIPRLLPYMAEKNYLSIFDSNNSKYLPVINYYGEGSYAPMAGRGYIVYEIGSSEIFRTIQWMS